MHQFVVPMVSEVRKDCTYGHLAAMRLPKEAKGSDSCEVSRMKSLSFFFQLCIEVIMNN